MKKWILIALVTLLVLAPTVALFTVYFFYSERYADVITYDIVSAKITDADGKTVTCQKGSAELSAFLSLHGNEQTKPRKLSSLPIETQSYTSFEVLYTDSYGTELTFTYYFSTDKNKCYYVNSDNGPYCIAPDNADAFLNSDYAECVYDDAKAPELRLAGNTLQPQKLMWQYKTVSGELKNASCSFENDASGQSSADSNTVGRFDASLALESNYEITDVVLRIVDATSGKLLFEGDKAALLEKIFPGSYTVKVDLSLTWGAREQSGYAGYAEYRFTGRLAGTPAFSLNTDFARCGDIVILSAFNIDNPDEIAIESEPALPYDPVFYKLGQNYQALLPLPAGMVADRTTYRMTVSSPSASDVLTLDVIPLNAGVFKFWSPYQSDYLKDDNALNTLWTNMMPVLTKRSDYTFDTVSGGKFVIPAAKNIVSATANYSFGMRIDVDDLNKSFIAWDNMYAASDRSVTNDDGTKTYVDGNYTEVLAAYKGTVVYVGAQYFTGRLVIIDHGSGLMTWYTNLSPDIAVKTGDVVEPGQFISHAADGGLNDRMNFNFHVGAFVNGIPVSLQQLINNGLIFEY